MPNTVPIGVHPPRPRLSLRVGVTGHRVGKSLADAVLPRVQAQVESILARCHAVASRVHGEHADVFAPEAPVLVAASCLAVGGDQIFARAALAQGWRLDSILPFAREDYARDFDSPERQTAYRELLELSASVFEIADPRSEDDASEAYETAGLVMLDHADILIAIWDGGESRGRGGTREILDESIRRGIPVIWINTTITRSPALWDGNEAVLLPELDAGIDATGAFDRCVALVIAPPMAGGSATAADAALRLKRFLGETEEPDAWWARGFDLLAYIAARKPLTSPQHHRSMKSRGSEWDGFINDLPDSGKTKDDMRDILLTRYLWADHVASRLGRAYRGAYVLNFVLAAASVLVGLLVVFFWDSVIVKTVCAIGEFALIALILQNTRAGAKGAWHARFLDARRLSEMIRHDRVLVPLARAGGANPNPTDGDAGELWAHWYARAAERELNLPRARADAGYLAAVSRATLAHEVLPQLAYHEKNHKLLHRMHHSIDHLGERIFYITAVLCLIWIAGAIVYLLHIPGTGWIKSVLKPLLTFLGAVLPALGAALAGIRAQGDFDASAKRSQATARQLAQLSKRMETLPTSYRQACLEQRWVADAMAAELGSWHVLYANRPLTIPG
ncbi:hypothetical protein GJW-30_1_03651 [Variibacter gotjawalensis]|uniref:SMODS and SLOG-associating 2TM effector domain-containing protein n=1 Tax=Variibacter gotjawalensis TaxID=1333996 RepID=A0A0S3PYR5_9BRAD|nr:hypothetical protein [Variibacter gotjawalensis]NIK46933.1 hypothetical protein [Variibacter gotjawalensis]RZS48837.1 hypothetical protein EV661_1258 [Variibacter gotjawalensis]BAT61096.1 hypothetical protein GJW-30_1_03651 [Variibacter gotjawalensis]